MKYERFVLPISIGISIIHFAISPSPVTAGLLFGLSLIWAGQTLCQTVIGRDRDLTINSRLDLLEDRFKEVEVIAEDAKKKLTEANLSGIFKRT